MDGFLCINKPAGMSSSDVVMNVRRFTGEKKTGHTGTLDVNACGLVVVALGKASRLIEYTDSFAKLYRCRAILGLSTDTHDIWGTPVRDVRGQFAMPDWDEIEDTLTSLEGQIEQVPSKYSALRQNGKRLYELAREGKNVTVKSRIVGIFSTSMFDYSEESGEYAFDVSCSTGTYVRTLCDMAGELLGCGSCMSFLLRMNASGFSLDEAFTLEELSRLNIDEIERRLLPLDRALANMPACELKSEERAERFLNGLEFSENQCVFADKQPIPGCCVSVYRNDRLLGVARCVNNSGRFSFMAEKIIK